MTQATITELDILSDAIAPNEGGLAPAAADSILKWKFPDRSIARMNELYAATAKVDSHPKNKMN